MSNRTMKQKMVHRFPITTTHTTPIYQNAIPKHDIIQSENPIVRSCPQEIGHSLRNLWFPHTLPRKQKIRITLNSLVIRSGIKLTIPFEVPSKCIPPIPPRSTRMYKVKKRVRCSWPPIFKSSKNPQVPHSESTSFRSPQNLRDACILGY